MDIIKYLLTDQFIFPAFQVGFLLFTIFAWAKDRGFFTGRLLTDAAPASAHSWHLRGRA